MSKYKILLLLALLQTHVFISCNNSENKATKTESDQTGEEGNIITNDESSQIKVEIAEDGTKFTIRNVSGDMIEEFRIVTYPPPLSSNILLGAYSFSKNVGTLEKDAVINIEWSELKDDKGSSLSDSKRKVGVIGMNGKIKGEKRGGLFVPDAGKWVPSPSKKEWSIVLEPILDDAEETKLALLNVEVGHFGVSGAPYILENKEQYPLSDIVVTVSPAKNGNVPDPKISFSKKIQSLEKGGTAVANPDEMKNEKGELLSESRVKIAFIKVICKVNGQKKGVMVHLGENEN